MNDEYEYKNYRELQVAANNKRIRNLERKIDRIQRSKHGNTGISSVTNNRVIRAVDKGLTDLVNNSLEHKRNVRINLIEREIGTLQRENARIMTMTKDQIIKGPGLKIKNHFYEQRASKIEDLVDEYESRQAIANSMSEGFVKRRETRKIAKLEKKITKLQNKNIKSEKKQVSKMISREKLRNLKNRHVNKLLATRDQYRQEMLAARAAQNIHGLTDRQRDRYTAQSLKYATKVRKLNTKLTAIRDKRQARAQGGNARTIPNGRRRRQGGPTR